VLLSETGVQPVLRGAAAIERRHVEAPVTKIGGSDLDEEGFYGLGSGPQVAQSLQHQVTARQRCQHTLIHRLII
jgi:hypothetical protein